MRGAALAIVTLGILAVSVPQAAPQVPAAPSFTVLDPGYNTGFYTDGALGTDGNPVLAYYDDTDSALVVIRCADPACRDRTRTVLDSEGHTGLSTSLALDDDRPVVSYYDLTERDLRLARCHDRDCDDVTTTTLDADTPELTGTALGLDAEGHPVVAYRGGTGSELRLVHCDDPACGAVTSMGLDGAGVDEGIALELVSDRLTVAYRREDRFRVATCALPCADATIETVGSPGTGFYPSVVSGSDGMAVLAHFDFDGKEVELIRCRDRACTDRERTVVEAAPLSGFFTALALDRQDRPQLAFYDEASGGLVVLSCATAECGDPNRVVVDASPLAGQHLALLDGPIIAYHDGATRTLRLVRCGDPECRRPDEATAPGIGVDTAVDGDGLPVVVYRHGPRAGVRVIRCLVADCSRVTSTSADDIATLAGPPSVAADPDGSPLVVFQDLATQTLRLTACPSSRCPFMAGHVIADGGSVGHSPDVLVGDDGSRRIVHRDESRGTIDLLRCRGTRCDQMPVVATAGRGGAVVTARGAGGEVLVAYHDDRTGHLALTSCSDAGCAEPITLAAASFPAPLAMAVRDDAGALAAVHRTGATGELELVTCTLPCEAPATVQLPVGAAYPQVRWDGGTVEVVHGQAGETVRRRCGADGCGPASPVATVEGPSAVAPTAGGRMLVAVLDLAGGAPTLAVCDSSSCRVAVPEVEPIR